VRRELHSRRQIRNPKSEIRNDGFAIRLPLIAFIALSSPVNFASFHSKCSLKSARVVVERQQPCFLENAIVAFAHRQSWCRVLWVMVQEETLPFGWEIQGMKRLLMLAIVGALLGGAAGCRFLECVFRGGPCRQNAAPAAACPNPCPTYCNPCNDPCAGGAPAMVTPGPDAYVPAGS
jgi:hypothetical protein